MPLGSIGPDFNGFSNTGNSGGQHRPAPSRSTARAPGAAGSFDFDGTATPNKDFCEDVKSEVKDGKQTITIKVNEKATYNDGTPIDVKAFQNTWNMLKGENKDIDIVTSGAYEFVDSVKAGASDKEVVVTTTQPVYPLDALFCGLIHPAVNTPEIFNTGFTGEMHPEWMAGPFKVDQYDSAAKTVTLVPNDKWWGAKPVLDKVVFRQLETSAAIAAFKNGEIDGVSANTIALYKQLEGTKNSEVRRGQRLFAGGLNLNAQKAPLTDVAIRKAIFTAVDREALRKVRFNGLNWEEPSSGSMMLLPFSKYYQDNYPVTETGPEAAKKVLTDAGYKPNAAGIMEKDGVPAAFKISNFGDDPTTPGLRADPAEAAPGRRHGRRNRPARLRRLRQGHGQPRLLPERLRLQGGRGRHGRRQAVLRFQDQRKRTRRRRTGRRDQEAQLHRGQRRAQQGSHGS